MSGRRLFVACVLVAALGGTGPARAQEDLNRGKTPPQLFVSDCTGSGCHRDPRGLAKLDARPLADFLRMHYTASKENAAAIAAYLVSVGADTRPARPVSPPRSAPATAAKPAEKPTEPDKDAQSKTAAPPANSSEPGASKPSEPAKPAEASAPKPQESTAKPAEAKPADVVKPAEAKPSEAVSEPKPVAPSASPPPASPQ